MAPHKRLVLVTTLLGCTATPSGSVPDTLPLELRSRVTDASPTDGEPAEIVIERPQVWDPRHTAIVICDMWDDHWCRGAARRVAELAVPMNELVVRMRDRGALIIHAPSSTVDFYADTPARLRAERAPFHRTPIPLSTAERWGTNWCWPDDSREDALPIDDSDMGCDCEPSCELREAWSRQIDTLEIHDDDAISHDAQEVWNLLEERDIDNVLLMGVHLNMCVLGRPFGIRQLVMLGKNVVLVRDMTDTMYNSRRAPFVNHFDGTDLVLEHVERFWCPTIASSQLTGKAPFRFAEDPRPR